jgi:putative endonuclease
MRVKDAVGRFGEQVAAEHLVAAGLTIVMRNWRCREGELDIVARDGRELVFVEVKTRSTVAFGVPSEAISRLKIARIRRLALLWMDEHRGNDGFWTSVRFDVVSVVRRPYGLPEVHHLRGAF